MDANELRRQYIRRLADSSNVTQEARDLADELFSLDLTVYSKNFSLKSVIYNSLSVSSLDPTVSLHPDQLEIIERMRHHEALIVSAPTSFGKTFCIFEYIARYQPLNIVLVVPTLALVDEYMKKVIKKYQAAFGDYQVFTSIDIDLEYDFSKHNLFILTHDRITQTDAYSKIKRIDFLVIDEVYKLETDKANDRVLVLNMAYYRLSKIAKKYVLLAPFLGGIADLEQLEKKPVFYRSDYSPVVNEIKEIDIITEKDRDLECNRVVQSLDQNEKTLIYFPSVSGMNKYIRETISKLPDADDITETVARFMAWAKEEIHEEWSVVKAMKKGYLVHNGQIPRGTRQFQLSQYENDGGFNKLLCTSTLLEGVNTRARNIVIEKAARGSRRSDNQFKAFDFYNLVGRTGRLNQNLIGTAYYLKGPHDPSYRMQDAVKIIRFELTDDSVDIDIQTEELCE